MRSSALGVITVGLIALFYSFNYEITMDGGNIINTGLVNQRTNFVILSCCILLIGGIWAGFGYAIDQIELMRAADKKEAIANKKKAETVPTN